MTVEDIAAGVAWMDVCEAGSLPSLPAKQPPVLPMASKAHSRDVSVEEERHAVLQKSLQLSGTSDDDSLALSTTVAIAAEVSAASHVELSASFCKPSQEDAKEPHDADAAPSTQASAPPALPAAARGAPPPGVPKLAVNIAVAVKDAVEDTAATSEQSHSASRRPVSASAVPTQVEQQAAIDSSGGGGEQQPTVRPPSGRQRPQSATARTGARDNLVINVQRSGSGNMGALGSVLEGGNALSPVADTSLTEQVALESPVNMVGTQHSKLTSLSVSRSSVCISDGSAESDEDVFANADLDDEDEDAFPRKSPQVLDSAAASLLASTVKQVDTSQEPADVPAAMSTGAQTKHGGGLLVAGEGEETEEQKERQLREQVDITVQMEMVQQYNQFEKVGSTLEGVAEDEQEEEEEEEGGQVQADDEETRRPLSSASITSLSLASSAALPSPTATATGDEFATDGIACDGIDGEHDMPREMSWERRQIEITPRGEHDLRVVRGDKPTRPDDRRARRAGRPPAE